MLVFNRCVLFLLLTSVLLVPTFSRDAKAEVKAIEVAFYEAGAFYSNGMGIDKDIVEEIKKRGGYTFNYTEKPRARIWKELEDGTLPLSVSGLQNADRDKFAWFIHYMAQRNKAIITNAKYKSADSLSADENTQIAVVRGFKHGAYFDGLVNKFRTRNSKNVYEVPAVKNLFLMLKSGNRVDMIISQPAFYTKELKDLGMESKVTIYDWDAKGDFNLGLILSKKQFSEAEYQKMKKIVQDMKKDGTIRKILAKYLSPKDVEEAIIK